MRDLKEGNEILSQIKVRSLFKGMEMENGTKNEKVYMVNVGTGGI